MNWAEVIERKREIAHLLARQEREALESSDVSIIRGRASFLSPYLVSVDGDRLEAMKVLIAVGSRVCSPPIPGLELAISSDEALEMSTLPESVVIIGGGVIAMEFAHIWNTVGVKVTVLEVGSRILASADEELSREMARLSRDRGIEIVTRSLVERVSRAGNGLEVLIRGPEGTRVLPASRVMVAAGRLPNTDGLGLERAGVKLEKGKILVNDYLQTTAPHIYSGGDAVGGYYLAPVAAYDGRLAAKNAVLGNVEKVNHRPLPQAVFTRPPLASVGWTEAQARSHRSPVVVTRLAFSKVARAVVEGETEGLAKVVTDGATGEILGAHILGARAEELIHQFAIAMKAGLTIGQLAEMIPVAPSFSESVFEAALSASGALRKANIP